jgi:hypothetical protein
MASRHEIFIGGVLALAVLALVLTLQAVAPPWLGR